MKRLLICGMLLGLLTTVCMAQRGGSRPMPNVRMPNAIENQHGGVAPNAIAPGSARTVGPVTTTAPPSATVPPNAERMGTHANTVSPHTTVSPNATTVAPNARTSGAETVAPDARTVKPDAQQ